MDSYRLVFDLHSDWHVGSGKEAGAYADALCLKDSAGLPYLPGKSIKGLLKEAFQLATDNQWFSQDLVPLLFGREGRDGVSEQGMLQISSGQLSAQESHYLIDNNVAKYLYRVHQFTAIDKETGTAKPSSLRSMEVAVPMQLVAQVRLNTQHPHYHTQIDGQTIHQGFTTWLDQAITLITALGGKRHRGLGQVTVSLEEA
ncbi:MULTISPECIES: RAMP superfamily CRISPR-associated protein [unclassified Salinivibrio]|uniref:RAMP superfamily CRISPR-associated protein n=1 Tax=unclassified Salinivibrio TaxID=2636825 RepID=UPI000984594F|nr:MULTISPECIES: RAMP superfamily CRISPR-associated protein [unclassified Salinivibrio]OOF09529.1 hypothetical protein BZG83_14935 [Salinivibrio sp. PR919]OOF17849.1 hypothetical protein BZG84_05985 [Salinivibrio sp. PR932]